MKQGLIQQNPRGVQQQQNHATRPNPGANSLAANQGQKKASFAKEFNKLQNSNELIRQSSETGTAQQQAGAQEALSADAEVAKFKEVLSQALANKGLNFDTLSPEMKEKLALMQDAVKQEVTKRQGQEESVRTAEDTQAKFSSNESTMANASQENQKQITDAVREGNVSSQEQAQQQSDDRQQQLANWEDLAPRVVEDPKNRAVRIDIPGLPEIETVIVRMSGAKVSIQTVGNGKVMEKLQKRQAELGSRLSAQNITLDDLKTFDSKVLSKGRVG